MRTGASHRNPISSVRRRPLTISSPNVLTCVLHRLASDTTQGLYLSDIQDHLITMTQNLNHYEKILSRSHSNYLAQISIEMTDANNQINDVLS